MDLVGIGRRIRAQREYLGYSRERLAELLDVTPKFCSDIELGLKGMSVLTLCCVSQVLKLSTDYILFGAETPEEPNPLTLMLQRCPADKQTYAEEILKNFLMAVEKPQDPE